MPLNDPGTYSNPDGSNWCRSMVLSSQILLFVTFILIVVSPPHVASVLWVKLWDTYILSGVGSNTSAHSSVISLYNALRRVFLVFTRSTEHMITILSTARSKRTLAVDTLGVKPRHESVASATFVWWYVEDRFLPSPR